MKKVKNIILVISLLFNILLLVYAFSQRADAERVRNEAHEQRKMAAQQQAIAEEMRSLAEEQKKIAEQQAAIAQEAREEAKAK